MVERVDAAETYDLRQRVLGRGRTRADLAAIDDGRPDSGHFAIKVDGRVVATGTVRRRPAPGGEVDAWQIRGMAVEPDLRRRGLGSAVLATIIEHVEHHGGGVVWCHARLGARSLYERQGFVAIGEPFVDPVAGPEVTMARRVVGQTDAGR